MQLWKALAKRLEGDLDCQLATPPTTANTAAEAGTPARLPEADNGGIRLFK